MGGLRAAHPTFKSWMAGLNPAMEERGSKQKRLGLLRAFFIRLAELSRSS
jgi:hypothetical protein